MSQDSKIEQPLSMPLLPLADKMANAAFPSKDEKKDHLQDVLSVALTGNSESLADLDLRNIKVKAFIDLFNADLLGGDAGFVAVCIEFAYDYHVEGDVNDLEEKIRHLKKVE
jgi:hypothetical protein